MIGEVGRLVELAGRRVRRLQHLRVLVVRHGLGGVDLAVEQRLHVELLLDERDVGGRDPRLRHAGEQLELVAEAPVADLLAAQVGGRRDPLVRERHLVGARTLEDLRDVGDARALLARGERLGHPGDRVVGLALREHRLRDDVHAALEDLHVEPALLVEALVDGGEVAGELALGHPLQLQLDGRQRARGRAGGGTPARRGLGCGRAGREAQGQHRRRGGEARADP